MNEKLQSILDCVLRTAGVIGDAAVDAACDVGTRTVELLSVGKRNIRAAELEAAVERELRCVGGMIYATHIGNPTDSGEVLRKLQEIDSLRAELNSLKRENARAKSLPVCGACGRIGEKGDLYCRDCGQRL